MKKIFCLSFIIALAFAYCKKPDLANNNITGEGLVGFTLVSPASSTNLVLNAALPDSTVTITWNASKPGLYAQPTYKWVAALKTGGDLNNPLISIPANSNGKDTKLTLTYKQIDDALAAKGIATGAKAELQWSVLADNGSAQILASNIFFITITRFQNGAKPFLLLGPSSTLTPIAMDPGSTTSSVKFNWTKSAPATGSPAVKYRVYFALRKTDANGNDLAVDFTAPLFSIASDNGGNDSVLTFTYKAISDSLNAHEQNNLAQPAQLRWTVAATSGTWTQWSDYVNTFVALREVRLYMPGSYTTPSWDPPTAPEMVRDMRSGGGVNSIYYTYVSLPANTEFKTTQGRAWDVNYGPSTSTTGTSGILALGSSNNFKIASAGIYRVSVDRVNMTYDIRTGRMGFVGDAIPGVGWSPSATFSTPAAQMTLLGRDKFIGIANFNVGGWKLIDNNDWNSGPISISDTRSYGATTDGSGNGTSMVINADNMPNISTAGRYRVIWDGSNVNDIKYVFNPANEMRVVGDGIQGVNAWDPGTSPQMTYMGNGKWQITLTLIAGKQVKFLAGNAWGAFDYEDAGGGKIRYDGNDNFNTPGGGTYTITLDEYAGTVTFN